MARLPRFVLPGHPQHVIIRGNNRDSVFNAEEDYHFFLDKLLEATCKHQCDVHAYVLMTNHVHLLITPHKEDGISKTIQFMGRYYVQYFNHTYRRSGTLWEGRYKASLIDSEAYALICYRYIELNPVRANMVNHPAAYPWSSFRGNALGVDDRLLTPHPLFLALGATNDERQMAYQALFQVHLDDKVLNDVRAALNKAWVLGSEHFRDRISAQLNRRAGPLPKGGDRRSAELIIGTALESDPNVALMLLMLLWSLTLMLLMLFGMLPKYFDQSVSGRRRTDSNTQPAFRGAVSRFMA